MTFVPSSVLLLAATASCLMNSVSSQTLPCIDNLTFLFEQEKAATDITVQREYTLCSNTVFDVGSFQPGGDITGGQWPLTLRSNAKVKCGDSGSSSNSCVIDGTGPTAMIFAPISISMFGEGITDNIVVQGVTVDFFLPAASPTVIVSTFGGDIKFLDCVFSNIQADPIFFFDQLIFAGGRKLETATAVVADADEIMLMSRESMPVKGGGGINDYNIQRATKQHHQAPVARKMEHTDNLRAAQDRKLQAEPLTITFNGCRFENNQILEKARSGLSLLKFRASDIFNRGPDLIATMNVNFFNNQFDSNLLTFEDDPALLRAVIEFYSIGKLHMENNCFVNSPLSDLERSATVLAFSEATVTSVNNFIAPSQNLVCAFVSEFDTDLGFVKCGDAVADAAVCGAVDTPAVAPTADMILPSTLETLQDSDQAATYFLRMAGAAEYTNELANTPVQNQYPLTSFVPLDSAFEALGANGIAYYNEIIDDTQWFSHVNCAVAHHLHLGSLPTSQWPFLTTVSNVQGSVLQLVSSSPPSRFFVDGTPLVDGLFDIFTGNGIIHHIAAPLEPNCVRLNIAVLLSSPTFATLIELAGIAGLLEDFETSRPLTIFAPTNAAFDKLSAEEMDFLRNNPEELRRVLLYHAVPAVLLSQELNGQDITTAANSTISIRDGDAILINGIAFAGPVDNLARNGVIHVIDTVLMPPDEAPTTTPPNSGATLAPVTSTPDVVAPLTSAPIVVEATLAPVTSAPDTVSPLTSAPIVVGGTAPPVTLAPDTVAPVNTATPAPFTPAPITPAPVTPAPITPAPVTPAPITPAPVTPAPSTAAPVASAPNTPAPVNLVAVPPTSGATTSAVTGLLGFGMVSLLSVLMYD